MVVGAGQSAAEIAKVLRPGSVRVIAVNRSIELFPWAEVMYAADYSFWRQHLPGRSFKGWKFGADDSIRYLNGDVHPVTIARCPARGVRLNEMVKGPVGVVGAGGNSGFQAVNLAVQFGASRVLLCLDYRGKHWHPDHSTILRNPGPGELRQWADLLDRQAGLFTSWGVEVWNVARNSALKAYPYADCRSFDPDPGPLPA